MQQRILKLFLVIVLLLYGCAPAIKNLDSEGTEIICFGDSITYGTGVDRGQDYPSYLSEMIGEEVINAGRGGDTTEDALNRLSDVLDRDPYIVIVEFGANDYLRDLPKDKAIENLREVITSIQDEGSMTALCDVSGGSSILGAYNIYHKDMKKLARQTGSIFIPHVMEGVIRNTSLKADRFHPNAKGNEIIAKKVYNAIKPYLK
ncbi:MAG: GDSL-type esterase/lipase family protein [Candidatus Omnitrophota bacterium]